MELQNYYAPRSYVSRGENAFNFILCVSRGILRRRISLRGCGSNDGTHVELPKALMRMDSGEAHRRNEDWQSRKTSRSCSMYVTQCLIESALFCLPDLTIGNGAGV
jgi:hypothetical protein